MKRLGEGLSKVVIARGITAAYLLLRYRNEMQENYAKGDWAEAAKDTAFFAVAITPIVAPSFFFGTVAYPVLVGAAIGVGATIAIVEITGIGTAEEVIEMVVDPPIDDWYEVVAPAVEEKFAEIAQASDDFQIAAVAWVDRRLMEGQHYLEQQYQEKKHQLETGWEMLTEYGRWANPVHLPF